MYNFDNVSALGESNGIIKDISKNAINASGYGGVARTGNGRYG